ncbi:MAG: cyclase family protein [Gammaproteobacteria bacterium]|nr:cyclase family protein [Gammaproteobacteria bacterium]
MQTVHTGASGPQWATLAIGGRELRVDLAHPHDLSIGVDFDGTGPRWFESPRAHSEPLASGSFVGQVRRGGSCNCSTISLTPHCDGTHTESAGHVTLEAFDVRRVVPDRLLPALLVTVTPTRAGAQDEGSRPPPLAGDLLITRAALARAWPAALPFEPVALIVRTLPNPPAKRQRDYRAAPAPFLSLPAATWLVERGIEHLVLDVPSADRASDQGMLSAHREFFGLAPGESARAAVRRPQCSITELAYIDDGVADGACLLALQFASLAGDALPSRPLLYPVQAP